MLIIGKSVLCSILGAEITGTLDFRRDMRRRPSDDDSVHEYGGQADDVRKKPLLPSGPSNAPPDANEFGDIDERFQPAGGSSSRHHDRRPKRPQSDDSGSESPDDDVREFFVYL